MSESILRFQKKTASNHLRILNKISKKIGGLIKIFDTFVKSEISKSEISMETLNTLFGRDVIIENGAIASKEDIIIEGKASVKLISTANVIIGESAVFEGVIIAHNVEIKGLFKGEVSAKENVIIRSRSSFCGKVRAFSLNIESGANFSGQSATISVDEFKKEAMTNKVYVRLVSSPAAPAPSPAVSAPKKPVDPKN